MLRRRSIALVLAFAALFGAPPDGWSQSPPTVAPSGADPADVAFRQGNALYKQQRYAEARAAYDEAFRLKKSHDIASNLAYAELKLGQNREAAEHLAFAVKNWPPTGKAENRESALHWLGVAKAAVVTLTVTVSVDGASVLVDGKPVGMSPLEREVFVEAGEHTVEVRLDGFVPLTRAVKGGAGEALRVEVGLERPVVAPPPVAPVVRRPLWPAVVSGALAVGGVAMGVGFTVAANGKGTVVGMLGAQVGGRSACLANVPQCGALRDAAATRDTLSSAALWSFVAGNAFALTTAGLVVWTVTTPRKAMAVHVVPLVGGGQQGVGVVGSW